MATDTPPRTDAPPPPPPPPPPDVSTRNKASALDAGNGVQPTRPDNTTVAGRQPETRPGSTQGHGLEKPTAAGDQSVAAKETPGTAQATGSTPASIRDRPLASEVAGKADTKAPSRNEAASSGYDSRPSLPMPGETPERAETGAVRPVTPTTQDKAVALDGDPSPGSGQRGRATSDTQQPAEREPQGLEPPRQGLEPTPEFQAALDERKAAMDEHKAAMDNRQADPTEPPTTPEPRTDVDPPAGTDQPAATATETYPTTGPDTGEHRSKFDTQRANTVPEPRTPEPRTELGAASHTSVATDGTDSENTFSSNSGDNPPVTPAEKISPTGVEFPSSAFESPSSRPESGESPTRHDSGIAPHAGDRSTADPPPARDSSAAPPEAPDNATDFPVHGGTDTPQWAGAPTRGMQDVWNRYPDDYIPPVQPATGSEVGQPHQDPALWVGDINPHYDAPGRDNEAYAELIE